MNIFQRIRMHIQDLDAQQFNRYLAIFFGVLLIIMIVIVFSFYQQVSFYTEEIETLNTTRKKEVKAILTTYKQVEVQRASVKRILEEDPNFKIREPLEEALKKLSIAKASIQETSRAELNDNEYQEVVLKATLADMNMKQLCELLQEIEKSKRIYTKELEIAQAKPGSINVQLTIGTLAPKAIEASE